MKIVKVNCRLVLFQERRNYGRLSSILTLSQWAKDL